MPKRGTFVTEPRTEQYDLKQSLVRSGYGWLPQELRTKAMSQIDVQRKHWSGGFARMHDAWLAVKARVLDPALAGGRISKFNYAMYKAFVNQYISKVVAKGSETTEMVKTKFVHPRMGADPGILDEITAVLGEVLE
jgi:hypothetical protein